MDKHGDIYILGSHPKKLVDWDESHYNCQGKQPQMAGMARATFCPG